MGSPPLSSSRKLARFRSIGPQKIAQECKGLPLSQLKNPSSETHSCMCRVVEPLEFSTPAFGSSKLAIWFWLKPG